MNAEPTLIVLAAGMGSRYGGLKQIDPVDEMGHVLIDYSLYDAKRAGFKNVIFVTKEADRKDFEESLANRMKKYFNVQIALQNIEDLPEGFSVPEGRVKPWGTSHAVLSCAEMVDGPIAVINADDYYGPSAYAQIYNYLTENTQEGSFAMVGYLLKNTVSDKGHVARGVCETENGFLTGIVERTMIQKERDGISYSEDDGNTWNPLDTESVVSMNFWGLTHGIFDEIRRLFPEFLEANIKTNPMKCEFYLPTAVNTLIKEDKARVEVLTSKERWYGFTYREDKQAVMEALASLRKNGVYPERLWDN